jgi:hypothetical protein
MDVPEELAEWQERFFGAAGRAWIAALRPSGLILPDRLPCRAEQRQ